MSALIECRDLSKNYGNQFALNKVSFEIQAGSPIALVGANGAGKSTLLSILSGYIKPSSGQVRVLGHTVGSEKLIGCIGALPQDALFDPSVTIVKQLTFLAQLQGFKRLKAIKEAERCLDLMQLLHIKNDKVGALSHGMKKRVAIAQALMGTPKLILLDEPTAGLDPENARNVRQQISALSNETTFIVSSHNLAELEKMCSLVMYLERGELKSLQSIGESQDMGSVQAYVSEPQVDYLTLILKQEPIASGLSSGFSSEFSSEFSSNAALATKIKNLSSVSQIKVNTNHEFVIQYSRLINPALDQQVLKLLAAENLEYRQITQGQSLEDQLFKG